MLRDVSTGLETTGPLHLRAGREARCHEYRRSVYAWHHGAKPAPEIGPFWYLPSMSRGVSVGRETAGTWHLHAERDARCHERGRASTVRGLMGRNPSWPTGRSGACRLHPWLSAWVLNRRSPCISAPNAGPDATSTGVPVQRVASWGETCARDRATLVLAAYVPGPFRLFVRRGRFRAPAPDALPAGTGAGDIDPCGSVRRYPG